MTALSQQQETRLIHHLDAQLLTLSRSLKRQTASSQDAAASLALLTSHMTGLLALFKQVPAGSASLAVAYLMSILDATMDHLTLLALPEDTSSIFVLLAEMDDMYSGLIQADLVTITEATRLRALFGTCRAVLFEKLEPKTQVIQELDNEEATEIRLEAQLSNVFQKSLTLLS
ncbi:hypothetical protein BCR37DRAFT_389585 [Protomyces lactucae-debilis]|uniref:Uncharacterized protein n=1 Tax=Protomyces lactucae-debilis TaxID=2754530 RepID=A0A1Y2EW33_PROLT|nr:uncharacterized protein BCR37DRAFT_389585 [Protomyces lactucae-debilis]ORY75760.1 hypothetical protein BCR37DRAFT_389585 [Protomyces lactucae-debilis]